MYFEQSERQQGRRFEKLPVHQLRAQIDDMQGKLISNAWAERFGKSAPNRRLNKAYMTARAILAEREGDYKEEARLRDTLGGLEERFDRETREVVLGGDERFALTVNFAKLLAAFGY